MQGFNCIMVYSRDGSKMLFCKRVKEPYKGLFNLVGGKIEDGESGFDAAYRELEEETGISRDYIRLHHKMDFTYYNEDCRVEVYAGRLDCEVDLSEEIHPLVWLDIEKENFFALDRFAGEGNIGHMVEQVRRYGMGAPEYEDKHIRTNFDQDESFSAEDVQGVTYASDSKNSNITKKQPVVNEIDDGSICLGVTGSNGGWITAIIKNGELVVESYSILDSIVSIYSNADEILVDMVIGLQSSIADVRPDDTARELIGEKPSEVFVAPCRQAVYADNISFAYSENKKVLGKRFSSSNLGVVQKIREVDTFLQENPQYKNVIKESNAEVCFAIFNGKTVMSKKISAEGMKERIKIISKYFPELTFNGIVYLANKCKGNPVDVIDAVCLAITANLVVQNKFQVIPEEPMKDETGILMQMILPKI